MRKSLRVGEQDVAFSTMMMVRSLRFRGMSARDVAISDKHLQNNAEAAQPSDFVSLAHCLILAILKNFSWTSRPKDGAIPGDRIFNTSSRIRSLIV